jgi:hypothetical protein
VVADAVAVARVDVVDLVVPVDEVRAAQVVAANVASDEVDDHDAAKKIQVLSSAS